MITAATESEAREIIARLEQRVQRHVALHHGRKQIWRCIGEGPPLVMFHGGHGSWLHWIRNVDALSRSHTLWLPDMPSFGESDSLEGHVHAADRMPRFVAALSATIDSVVGKDAEIDLGGFSFGAITAVFVAAHRGHVRRLALLGVGAHGGPRRQDVELLDWRVPDRGEMLAALRQNLVPFMLHDVRRADALALAIHEWSCVHTRFRTKQVAQAGGVPAAMDRIPAPTLLVWGEHDVTSVPAEAGPRLVAGHPNRQLRIIEDAGHWVQYEKPDEINALLTEWFAHPA